MFITPCGFKHTNPIHPLPVPFHSRYPPVFSEALFTAKAYIGYANQGYSKSYAYRISNSNISRPYLNKVLEHPASVWYTLQIYLNEYHSFVHHVSIEGKRD